MTTRKEKILNTALELFVEAGYDSVSTREIAKKAGVSEGLIFRHFGNKKELLDTLTKEAEEMTTVLLAPVIIETQARKVIRKTIQLPFRVMDHKELYLFKLQLIQQSHPEYSKPGILRPLTDKLTGAFKALNYKEAEKEARLLNHAIHDLLHEMAKGNLEQSTDFKKFLLKKYKVNKKSK